MEMLRDAPLPAPAQADQPQPEIETEVPMSATGPEDRAVQSLGGAQPSHVMSSSPEQGLLVQQVLLNSGNAPVVTHSPVSNTGVQQDPNPDAALQDHVSAPSTARRGDEDHAALLASVGTEPEEHDLEVSEPPSENGKVCLGAAQEKADIIQVRC